MDDVGVRMNGPITSSDDVEVHGVCIPDQEERLQAKNRDGGLGYNVKEVQMAIRSLWRSET